MTMRVAVVGGGLAGISAALRCADAGCDVTLTESKPWLGGLTHSFRRGDLWVDNGQHVFLRCCTSYRALLERLGVGGLVTLQPRLDIPVRSGRSGRTCRLRGGRLPAPLHLAGSLAAYRFMTPIERARAASAALALRRVDVDDPRTDQQTFHAWLRQHKQSSRSIEVLWDLFGVATLNAHAGDVSLASAAGVFQRGLLEDAHAGDVGFSRVPLRALHGDAALRALTGAGVRVLTRTRVRGLARAGGGWSLGDGQTPFDRVVLAVPAAVAENLLPQEVTTPGLAQGLGTAPIVNTHVVYDRQVLDEPFLAAVDGDVQWVFDRTASSGLQHGQYVVVSWSAADDVVDLPTATVADRVVAALSRLLPTSGRATVQEVFVTREREATFRAGPGVLGLRPSADTNAPGLYLAGAWTDTGWPATMEGAVRSGETAARLVLSADNTHLGRVVPV
jgi:hydroxysqualene dehydroxylase